ncbi:hypothetical protein TUM4630_27720 [Shewanella algidipiscicola]|uniref:Uncharacterized protein n=1 Tax=Shewanella algidipiscicola TaxID=614070 RepID=A0ABQ4PM88_9GAMM|nr:hypothetical protein TUM4630_27720 [Shewanella algidipiscicola]
MIGFITGENLHALAALTLRGMQGSTFNYIRSVYVIDLEYLMVLV